MYHFSRSQGTVYPNERRNPLTQLVAAICENGNTIVTVSDRMVSTGDMTLTFEHSDRKAQPITKNAVVLIAGTMHEPDLIRDLRERAKGKDRIRDIADICKILYQELRKTHIEDEIINRRGLGSFEEYQAKQRMLHDSQIMEINERVAKYNLGLEIMLVGVDDEAHISQVTNPGTWRSFDNLGYCCIGMGDRHAANVFAWHKYSRNMSSKDAIYIAFEAKKRAEAAGGVGQASDLLVISKEGIKELKTVTVKALEEAYNETEAMDSRRDLDARIKGIKIQSSLLESSSS